MSEKRLRLFTDGAARGNPGPAGIGIVIEDSDGMRLQGQCRYLGETTNNQAEYLALIQGLKTALEWKPDRLEVFLDSKLVAEQVGGTFRVKNALLAPLHRQATELLEQFTNVKIGHVEREKNRGADALANRAIDEWQEAHGKVSKRRPGGKLSTGRGGRAAAGSFTNGSEESPGSIEQGAG